MEKDTNEWRDKRRPRVENSLWPAKGTPFGKRTNPDLSTERSNPPIGTRKEILGVSAIIVGTLFIYLFISLDIGDYAHTQYLRYFEPGKYQEIIQKIEDDFREARRREIDDLEKIVTKVPVSDHKNNLRIYRKLTDLAPQVVKYRDKIKFYEARKYKYDVQMRQKERADAAAARRERLSTGFHCLSDWDGSHERFKEHVHRNMREPDSFEHIKTYIWRADSNGENLLKMKYRARNGFGGMNIGYATARIDNGDCSFVLVSIQ